MSKLTDAWNTFQEKIKALRQRQRKVLDEYSKEIDQKKVEQLRKQLLK